MLNYGSLEKKILDKYETKLRSKDLKQYAGKYIAININFENPLGEIIFETENIREIMYKYSKNYKVKQKGGVILLLGIPHKNHIIDPSEHSYNFKLIESKIPINLINENICE